MSDFTQGYVTCLTVCPVMTSECWSKSAHAEMSCLREDQQRLIHYTFSKLSQTIH